MQKDYSLMIALIKDVLYGNNSPLDESIYVEDSLAELFSISDVFDISQIIYFRLFNDSSLHEDLAETFSRTSLIAIKRYENIRYELPLIKKCLSDNGIRFIPLKGVEMYKYYKEPWLRTCSDVDILIDKVNLKRATKLLTEKLGLKYETSDNHGVTLRSPGEVFFELHHTAMEKGYASNSYNLLSNIWDYTTKSGDGLEHNLTDAMFYLYHVAHMAKHFENGGCGIRPFIDLWYLNNYNNADLQGRKNLLNQAGLSKFNQEMVTLTDYWFNNGEKSEITDVIEKFIFGGGIYGSLEQNIVMYQVKSGGRKKYLFQRIFLPYRTLVCYYPVLEKHKYLVPFYVIKRWFGLLSKKKRDMALREYKAGKNLEADVKEISGVCKKLELFDKNKVR